MVHILVLILQLVMPPEIFIRSSSSKYPPAKPVALQLLVPQRGLIAIEKTEPVELATLLRNHGNHLAIYDRQAHYTLPPKNLLVTLKNSLPELPNFGSPPAELGVYLEEIIELRRHVRCLYDFTSCKTSKGSGVMQAEIFHIQHESVAPGAHLSRPPHTDGPFANPTMSIHVHSVIVMRR